LKLRRRRLSGRDICQRLGEKPKERDGVQVLRSSEPRSSLLGVATGGGRRERTQSGRVLCGQKLLQTNWSRMEQTKIPRGGLGETAKPGEVMLIGTNICLPKHLMGERRKTQTWDLSARKSWRISVWALLLLGGQVLVTGGGGDRAGKSKVRSEKIPQGSQKPPWSVRHRRGESTSASIGGAISLWWDLVRRRKSMDPEHNIAGESKGETGGGGRRRKIGDAVVLGKSHSRR